MDSEIKNKWNRGGRLTEQSRQIVFNVATFLKVQKLKYSLNYRILESTSAATGVSIDVVKNILRDHKQLLANRNAPAPLKQCNTKKEEQEKTVINKEVNIKQEQSDSDYRSHLFDTTLVGLKVEPELIKAEMTDMEAMKQGCLSQLEENMIWNKEHGEASSDCTECNITTTASEIVCKFEEGTIDLTPSIHCEVCGKVFSCGIRLVTHRRKHFRVIKCDKCGNSYKILRSAKWSAGAKEHVCKASD